MKKLLIINETLNGSHGKICVAIAKQYEANGYEVKIAFGRNDVIPENAEKHAYRIGSSLNVKVHALWTRLTDKTGFGSKAATKRFLKWADEFSPDEIWLHNLHGYYINIGLLLNWIKSKPSLKVKWTLHDCWSFTGHCFHFTYVKCDKWKTGCHHCPQTKLYPKSYIDHSRWNYQKKKSLFTGIKDMTIIVPSHFIADFAKQSFLKEYPIEVIPNIVDNTIFKPTPSDFREKYHLANKKVILSVASSWYERKGLIDMAAISYHLNDSFVLVMVGLTPEQEKLFAPGTICIHRTENQKQLAEIYSSADLFVNASYEESFSMTTLEAQSCRCFPIVYKNTACEEVVNSGFGKAVDWGYQNLIAAIYDHFSASKEGVGEAL